MVSKVHHVKCEKVLPYSVKQIYDIILDIEAYPEFLPWCTLSRIVGVYDDHLFADLVVRYGIFTEKYRSKVSFSVCSDSSEQCQITAHSISGPFKELGTVWEIYRYDNGKSQVKISVNFSLKSSMLDILIGKYLTHASEKMISAFESRAGILYPS